MTGPPDRPVPAPPSGASRPSRFGWLRSFPLPVAALVGLGLGAMLTFLAGRADLGNLAWYATLIGVGAPLVLATVRRLIRREFASDVVATMAILGAIVLEQPLAGVVIVVMQSGGEAIEAYAFRRASSSLEQLIRRAPRTAHRRQDGQVLEVDVEEVRPGDRLVVRGGDLVPVDGRVASPAATIDESTVTGESLPRTRALGETILSGTVNVGAAFEMDADRPSRESQYMRIVELVQSARTRKPAIQRLADRYATWFTPLSLAIALLASVLDRSALTGLAVLVVATPCPLILATPIAIVRGVDVASARGMITKSGAALEELGRARVVLFDKTGTLTVGHPAVDRVVSLDGSPPEEILAVAGSVEVFSSHPLAKALRPFRPPSAAAAVPDRVEDFPGAGIAATLGGHRIVVGSDVLAASMLGRAMDAEWAQVRASGPVQGRLVVFVVRDGVPIGSVLLKDPLRREAVGLGPVLRSEGIVEVGLLTGDNAANAREVAGPVGVGRVESGLTPERKVALVGEYRRRYGSTVMVGDGINDAAALASASVGVAMGAEGAGISAEAADVVLVVDDVSRVADGIRIGRRMLAIAQQGILLGLGASLVLMGIASFGLIAPATGAVLQEVVDVSVIFNALRVR